MRQRGRCDYWFVVTEIPIWLDAGDPPGQQPADQLPLLLAVAGPVPLHMLVEVVPQQVAAVFGIHFSHLKNKTPHDVTFNLFGIL